MATLRLVSQPDNEHCLLLSCRLRSDVILHVCEMQDSLGMEPMEGGAGWFWPWGKQTPCMEIGNPESEQNQLETRVADSDEESYIESATGGPTSLPREDSVDDVSQEDTTDESISNQEEQPTSGDNAGRLDPETDQEEPMLEQGFETPLHDNADQEAEANNQGTSMPGNQVELPESETHPDPSASVPQTKQHPTKTLDQFGYEVEPYFNWTNEMIKEAKGIHKHDMDWNWRIPTWFDQSSRHLTPPPSSPTSTLQAARYIVEWLEECMLSLEYMNQYISGMIEALQTLTSEGHKARGLFQGVLQGAGKQLIELVQHRDFEIVCDHVAQGWPAFKVRIGKLRRFFLDMASTPPQDRVPLSWEEFREAQRLLELVNALNFDAFHLANGIKADRRWDSDKFTHVANVAALNASGLKTDSVFSMIRVTWSKDFRVVSLRVTQHPDISEDTETVGRQIGSTRSTWFDQINIAIGAATASLDRSMLPTAAGSKQVQGQDTPIRSEETQAADTKGDQGASAADEEAARAAADEEDARAAADEEDARAAAAEEAARAAAAEEAARAAAEEEAARAAADEEAARAAADEEAAWAAAVATAKAERAAADEEAERAAADEEAVRAAAVATEESARAAADEEAARAAAVATEEAARAALDEEAARAAAAEEANQTELGQEQKPAVDMAAAADVKSGPQTDENEDGDVDANLGPQAENNEDGGVNPAGIGTNSGLQLTEHSNAVDADSRKPLKSRPWWFLTGKIDDQYNDDLGNPNKIQAHPVTSSRDANLLKSFLFWKDFDDVDGAVAEVHARTLAGEKQDAQVLEKVLEADKAAQEQRASIEARAIQEAQLRSDTGTTAPPSQQQQQEEEDVQEEGESGGLDEIAAVPDLVERLTAEDAKRLDQQQEAIIHRLMQEQDAALAKPGGVLAASMFEQKALEQVETHLLNFLRGERNNVPLQSSSTTSPTEGEIGAEDSDGAEAEFMMDEADGDDYTVDGKSPLLYLTPKEIIERLRDGFDRKNRTMVAAWNWAQAQEKRIAHSRAMFSNVAAMVELERLRAKNTLAKKLRVFQLKPRDADKTISRPEIDIPDDPVFGKSARNIIAFTNQITKSRRTKIQQCAREWAFARYRAYRDDKGSRFARNAYMWERYEKSDAVICYMSDRFQDPQPEDTDTDYSDLDQALLGLSVSAILNSIEKQESRARIENKELVLTVEQQCAYRWATSIIRSAPRARFDVREVWTGEIARIWTSQVCNEPDTVFGKTADQIWAQLGDARVEDLSPALAKAYAYAKSGHGTRRGASFEYTVTVFGDTMQMPPALCVLVGEVGSKVPQLIAQQIQKSELYFQAPKHEGLRKAILNWAKPYSNKHKQLTTSQASMLYHEHVLKGGRIRTQDWTPPPVPAPPDRMPPPQMTSTRRVKSGGAYDEYRPWVLSLASAAICVIASVASC